MIDIIRKAKLVRKKSSLRGSFTHTINIPNRWLYDQSSGEISLLSHLVQPVYRISDSDKPEFDTLIKEEPNQSPEPTP